jgi:hypothetical protein
MMNMHRVKNGFIIPSELIDVRVTKKFFVVLLKKTRYQNKKTVQIMLLD